MKTCTKWKVFGPGPHLGPKCRQGAPEYQENDSKTKHSGPPISTFPGIHVKTYIVVYVFWYFWGPFPWISCHTSKTIYSDWTGRRGFDAISASFSHPEKQPINSYVYVGILRWFFKNTGFREYELHLPSAVRPHLEAFHVFQLRGLIGIPT